MGPGLTAMAATISDPLPTTLPRLEPTGSNWAIFSMRFQEAMEANQKWRHFDGTSARPVPVDDKNPTDVEAKAMAAWDQDETVTHYLLSQRLPDSTTASVKVGGVPQCSGEVEHCGTLGTPAPFQSSVEWCG